MKNIKDKILLELENPDFIDLKFLYSKEALEVATEIFEKLLSEEKKDFDKKINSLYAGLDAKRENIKMKIISFDLFEEFSKLDLFVSILYHLDSVNSNDKIRKIIEKIEPKYVEFGDYIGFNKRYYSIMCYCRQNCNLNDEQKRILDLAIQSFEVKGINLDSDKQKELKQINQKLAKLSTTFTNNIVDDKKNFHYKFDSVSDISDMPKNDLEEAKARAKKAGKKGYLFDASETSYSSIMKYCKNPEIRKKFYIAKNQFASKGKYSNKENTYKILKLKQKKAKILGYKNYAELSFVFKMAENPSKALKIIKNISKKALKKAKDEIKTLEKYFCISGIKNRDYAYYSRIYKEQVYKFDEKEYKKYFEFEATLAGLFTIVNKLYGIEMKEIELDSYSKDLKIYEVYKDAKLIAYFMGDYFYNPDKRQGAWCEILRHKFFSSEKSYLPIMVNVCNFQKNSKGKILLNKIDVETIFHEFGHAIHEMLSKSKYSDLSGFNVEWDFVELPSQLMELFANEKEALDLFARHYKTGEKIPENLLDSLKNLQKYGNGNFVIRQNEFAIMDLKIHMKKSFKSPKDLEKYISKIVEKYSAISKPKKYKMYNSFSHIFGGGYSAGYYSYMRAQIIEFQVWEQFLKNGIFDKENANKFYEAILSAGTTKKASELFYDYCGEKIEIKPFLKQMGLVKNKKK